MTIVHYKNRLITPDLFYDISAALEIAYSPVKFNITANKEHANWIEIEVNYSSNWIEKPTELTISGFIDGYLTAKGIELT